MRYLAPITMLILALAIMPPVNAQIFKPDIDKDHPAYIKKDFVTALKHYRALAAQGHAPAQYRIGTMYHLGEGLTVDYKKAAYWYRKAAMQGYFHAQRELGILLNKGEGVLQDRVMALVWWNLAGAAGDPFAQQYRDQVGAKLTASERKLALKLFKLCLQTIFRSTSEDKLKNPAKCPEYSVD